MLNELPQSGYTVMRKLIKYFVNQKSKMSEHLLCFAMCNAVKFWKKATDLCYTPTASVKHIKQAIKQFQKVAVMQNSQQILLSTCKTACTVNLSHGGAYFLF